MIREGFGESPCIKEGIRPDFGTLHRQSIWRPDFQIPYLRNRSRLQQDVHTKVINWRLTHVLDGEVSDRWVFYRQSASKLDLNDGVSSQRASFLIMRDPSLPASKACCGGGGQQGEGQIVTFALS